MRSPGLRSTRLLMFALCVLSAFTVRAAGVPPITGHWTLIEDESDDPRDALKGLTLIRERSAPEESRSRGVADQASSGYYAQRALAEKRRMENAVADVGPLERVIYATVLDIDDAGATASVRYDGGYTRTFAPTEGGPVYSAKGNEYKADALGLELAFRRDGLFVIETMLRPRGRMLEEFKLEPGGKRLTVTTTIDNPDWVIEARLRRVFSLNGAED